MTETKLKFRHTLWVLDNQSKSEKAESTESFDEKLKPVITFGTVEQFWEFFQYLKKPSQLSQQSDIYIFKEGIKPLWEDPQNQKGGSFTIKIEKKKGDKVWENAVLSCISPAKSIAACINGVRLKTKEGMDIIQIWMNSTAEESMAEIKQYLKDSLQVTDDKVFVIYLFSYHLRSMKGREKRDTGGFKGRQR